MPSDTIPSSTTETSVTVPMPKAMRDELSERAKANERSLAAEIRVRLAESLAPRAA